MVGSQNKNLHVFRQCSNQSCDWSQASWRYSWRVLASSKANQPVPVQPSGRTFEGVQTPLSVQQSYVEDVRTTEQQCPDARSISIQQQVGFQKLTLLGSLSKPFGRRGNTSERCPAFQNIPVFSSNATRSYSEDRPDARSSLPDMDLIKIELRVSERISHKTVRTWLTSVRTLDN